MSNNRLTDEAEVSADCKHPVPEYLGENRGVKFLRGDVCSRVYVLQEGRGHGCGRPAYASTTAIGSACCSQAARPCHCGC